jgi:uncharacterized membrane protein
MVKLVRLLKHAFADPFAWRRAFPQDALARIEAAIADAEKAHAGELRFAVENALALHSVVLGQTPRERAVALFSELRVWDTEDNSGVLIYLLMAERDIEIVADRGVAARVAQAEWDAVARTMEAAFTAGEFEAGVLAGIKRIGELLAAHWPTVGHNPDELPNRAVIVP